MARGVCANSPAARVNVKEPGTQVDYLLLGMVQVGYLKIQVELLGHRSARPLRCPVITRALECEDEASDRVKRREISTD